MCNLYSHTKGPQAIRELVRALENRRANLLPQTSIFPDDLAPVVRCTPDGSRELFMMRWGNAITATIQGQNHGERMVATWLGEGHRCLVPVTSFCEYDWRSGNAVPTWFALDESRPLFFFAGIWRPFFGERKGESGQHLAFSFLITEANARVRPVHEKAMPVILATREARETWMQGSLREALALQRPAPDDALRIVAAGRKEDGGRTP